MRKENRKMRDPLLIQPFLHLRSSLCPINKIFEKKRGAVVVVGG